MAATAKRQKPIGSKEWIVAEKENVTLLVNQELEEVEYPARHEMEWLNEHMAEIFRGSSLNVTELFKTPGRMRGKTPRTIRKHQTPRTARAPLSEIFSATRNRSPLPRSHFNQQIERLTKEKSASRSPLGQKQNQNSNPNYNTDSGYHGMYDDDDMQMIPTEPNTQVDSQMEATKHFQREQTPQKEPTPFEEPSFHSAREAASKEPTVEPTAQPMQVDFEPAAQNEHGEMDFEYTFPPRQDKQPEYPALPTNEGPSPSHHDIMHDSMLKSPEPANQVQHELDDHLDDIGSPSDNSTPDRPLIRKSSLNFASLPAREPLNTKRSMGGARNSYIDRGFFGRQTGARLTQAEKIDERIDVEERPEQKSSTQLLHEKINMLGKTQAPRTTKSISANAQSVAYPDLSASRREPSEERIRPREQTPAETLNRPSTSQQPQTARKNFESPRPQTSYAERKTPGSIHDGRSPRGMFNPSRFWHGKSNSTSSMLSSPPKNAEQANVDTPANSPGRYEGPLSASRGRLQSIMKSAKGLFSSSAGASANARLESQSPTANRSLASPLQRAESRMAQHSPVKPEGRRTRSSTEREQRRKQEESRERERREQEERERREREEQEERERIEREEREERERIEREEREERERVEREEREERQRLERERERERVEREERERKEKEEQRAREEERRKEAQKNAPVMQKLDRVQIPVARMNQSSPRKPLKPAEEEPKFAIPKPKGRPVKPTRDTAKPKPQPVSIRVGTHSQRMAMSQHQPEPAPSMKLRSTGNNISSTSLHTTASSSSFKSNSSAASTKSKSTVAKKKETEAQRRLEARREADRKKAAQEEARRQEQAEAERRERERAAQEDPKKAAQRQAIEKRRLENARKLEQQRVQATPSRPRASTMQDRPTFGAAREQPPARPASRLQGSQRPINVPMPNPAKPPKRAMDEDSSRIASVKPGVIQQTDGKRRKTDEELEQPVRPTMAPPIRQSGVRKDTIKAPGYGGGYSTMPAQHGSSMFRNPSLGPRQYPPNQRPGHPLDLSKYASGKIPFAEPPVNQAPVQPVHYSMHNKTPAQAQRPPKSSPAYPNGDAIKLPEIPTDSEDSDSDAEPYNVPDWAREENLGQILMDQEGRDGEAVFGPSAPLQMEEIFKDNKERFKRFRDRTSSANWLSTGDGLTAEEVRWDLEQREKLKRNGGWTYNPSSPAPR